jgi:PKD repeat protein
MKEGSYDVRLTATNQYGSDSIFKSGTSAPATPVVAETAAAPVAPSAPAVGVTTAATSKATATPTRAPVSLFVTVLGALVGLLAIVAVHRK